MARGVDVEEVGHGRSVCGKGCVGVRWECRGVLCAVYVCRLRMPHTQRLAWEEGGDSQVLPLV